MREWKPIPEFDGYEISSDGLCMSYKRHKPVQMRLRMLRGYVRYCLRDINKKPQTLQAHRLVWLSFVGPIPDGLQINHKNGIKNDNRLENIEVVTHSENMFHRYRELGIIGVRGSKNNFAKLTESDVAQIRMRLKNGESHASIAKLFPVSRPNISHIATRKTWPNVP